MHHHNPQMIQMIQGNGQNTLHGWSTNGGPVVIHSEVPITQRVWVGMAGFAVKYPSFIWRHFDIYVGHLPALFGDRPENSPQVIGNISFDDFDLDQQDLGGNLSWIEPSDLSQVACQDHVRWP